MALRQSGINDDYWLRIVEQHHERHDGTGYQTGCAEIIFWLKPASWLQFEYYVINYGSSLSRSHQSRRHSAEHSCGLPADEPTDLYLALIDVVTPYPQEPWCNSSMAKSPSGDSSVCSRGSNPPPRVKAVINPKGGLCWTAAAPHGSGRLPHQRLARPCPLPPQFDPDLGAELSFRISTQGLLDILRVGFSKLILPHTTTKSLQCPDTCSVTSAERIMLQSIYDKRNPPLSVEGIPIECKDSNSLVVGVPEI